jgi:hypothetical protein
MSDTQPRLDGGVDVLRVAEKFAPEVVYLALRDTMAELERVTAALREIEDPSYVGNYSPEKVVSIYRTWAHNALRTDLGGDPVEVHPAQSLAERQSELNDPSGSPTSPPKRDAAIAACPTPVYHETHRYCPSCPWTEDVAGGARAAQEDK